MKLRAVAIKESLGQTYSLKRAIRYRLAEYLLESPRTFEEALAQLKRAPKQLETFFYQTKHTKQRISTLESCKCLA